MLGDQYNCKLQKTPADETAGALNCFTRNLLKQSLKKVSTSFFVLLNPTKVKT